MALSMLDGPGQVRLRQALEQAGEQANADQVLEFVKQAAPAAFGEQLVRCVKNYL